jgi:hypothetical protein
MSIRRILYETVLISLFFYSIKKGVENKGSLFRMVTGKERRV